MPESPLIFVSHSSKDNDITEQLCQALRAEGAGGTGWDPVVNFEKLQDCDVLVDFEELQAGKPWPKQLHEWMARCHGAVLLLTSNAVKSPWVLKEATILAWRLSLEESFKFFIVRYDDVSDSDLTVRGFAPLMLNEIQKLTVRDAADIAAQVRKAMLPPTLTTPYKRLYEALEDLVRGVPPNTLRNIAEKMSVGARQWRPDQDQKQQYVEAIAVKLLSEDLGGYEGVDNLVDDLIATTSTEIVKKILYIVAPHWVDAAAAGRLPSVAKCEPRRAIAMNGALPDFTADMYVRRAYPLSRRQRALSIPCANSGDIVDHVTQELYQHAQREKRSPGSSEASKEEQKAAVIKHFDEENPRYFVVLSEPHPSGADLKELMTRFPKLTFILWMEELPDPEPEAVVCLKPEVDLDEEEKQRQAHEVAMDIIRGST
jgi:TIR domain